MSPASFEPIEICLADGVVMRGRRYAGGRKTPVLCLHGLTRNVKDFEDVAPRLAGGGRDVYALSFRGRGESDPDPEYRNYHPVSYRDDVIAALETFDLPRAAFIGASLGGIVTMLVAEAAPARVAAAVINDIGPALAPEGIARIVSYVGGGRPDASSLDEAAAQIRAVNDAAFPGKDDAFWRRFAERTFRERSDGRWVLDYDQRIGLAFKDAPPAPDLWPAFAALATKPTLVIRGALSDLLTPPIIEEMRGVHPNFDYCEVPDVGHAPMLTEPEAAAAIDRLLARAP